MKRLVACFGACLVMMAAASGSFAQLYGNPCEADIAKFCANVRPGSGGIVDCLNQNEAQLSPECRKMHLDKLGEVLRQTEDVCEADSSKFCGAERQQGVQLLRCLRTNQPGLLPDCRKKLYEALELMHY